MSMPCYISIKGETQGLITAGASTAASIGDAYVEGHEDEIMVQAFSHDITIPTDPQSGQPSSQRVHRPLRFTVSSLNKAIPLLYNALTKGEKINEVKLKWYRISTGGQSEHFFTTSLEGATVTSIRCEMPHSQDPAMGSVTQEVIVSLSYRKIIWDHVTAGTTGEDDWRKPNAHKPKA